MKTIGITWRYYIFSFLSGLSFYTAALVPFYTNWGHISLTQVQFLQAWLMIWAFVLEIPTGVIADKFGRKYSVAIGCLFIFISFLVYGTFPYFMAFLVAEFFAALGMALMSGASEALLYDSLKEENKTKDFKNIFGKSFSIGQISAIISAPIGGYIASKYGLNIPMLVTSIPALISTLLILTVKEPSIIKIKSANTRYSEIAKNGINSLIKNKQLMLLALNGILIYTGVYFVIWLYQPLLQQLGVNIVYFGFIRSIFSVSGIIFATNLPKFEKLFGSRKNYFNLTAITSILSLSFIIIYPSIITIILAIIILGGIGQARFMALNSYMNELVPSAQRATSLSAISMLNRLILIVLNPVVGYVADQSIRGAFVIICIISILAVIIVPLHFSNVKKQTIKL
ncbi:MAG: MFS transporter [bacterium]